MKSIGTIELLKQRTFFKDKRSPKKLEHIYSAKGAFLLNSGKLISTSNVLLSSSELLKQERGRSSNIPSQNVASTNRNKESIKQLEGESPQEHLRRLLEIPDTSIATMDANMKVIEEKKKPLFDLNGRQIPKYDFHISCGCNITKEMQLAGLHVSYPTGEPKKCRLITKEELDLLYGIVYKESADDPPSLGYRLELHLKDLTKQSQDDAITVDDLPNETMEEFMMRKGHLVAEPHQKNCIHPDYKQGECLGYLEYCKERGKEPNREDYMRYRMTAAPLYSSSLNAYEIFLNNFCYKKDHMIYSYLLPHTFSFNPLYVEIHRQAAELWKKSHYYEEGQSWNDTLKWGKLYIRSEMIENVTPLQWVSIFSPEIGMQRPERARGIEEAYGNDFIWVDPKKYSNSKPNEKKNPLSWLIGG